MVEAIVDTSVIVDYLRKHLPARMWFESAKEQQLAITPVVWLETIQGAQNKMELQRALRFLERFHLEHPVEQDNLWATEQLTRFHLSHQVEFQDAMIASVAVRLNIPALHDQYQALRPAAGCRRTAAILAMVRS